MRRKWLCLWAVLVAAQWVAGLPSAPAGETDPGVVRKAVFGLLLHDRGPASDRHERGVDPNWELQFNPPAWAAWRWIGRPYTIAGLTPNFNGDTSVFYGGLNYELTLSNGYADRWMQKMMRPLFISGSVTVALHNGPLHKNPAGCREKSDCGFGYRVLPRLAIEFGGYLARRHGWSLFYDHMSHKGVLPGENEGIDHIGIRYHFLFNPSKS